MNFFNRSFQTRNHRISDDSPVYLVAEIGLNHNGDLSLAKKTMEAAKESGSNAVKFQFYSTDFFIHSAEKIAPLKEIFQKNEVSVKGAKELKLHADSLGIDFFATPLSLDWVSHLDDLDVPFIKVASGDLNNYQMLYAITSRKRPVIISNGAASLEDFSRTVSFLEYRKFRDAMFLYCVSLYPADLDLLRMDTIDQMQQLSGALIGFSDHTRSTLAPFAAVIKGARIIEKHFTLDKSLPGPDHSISANPEEFKEIRKKIDLATAMKGVKEAPHDAEVKNDYYGKRSIYRVGSKFYALRPREKNMPMDSDFDQIMWERFNQD